MNISFTPKFTMTSYEQQNIKTVYAILLNEYKTMSEDTAANFNRAIADRMKVFFDIENFNGGLEAAIVLLNFLAYGNQFDIIQPKKLPENK